jgi:hypothetical protein
MKGEIETCPMYFAIWPVNSAYEEFCTLCIQEGKVYHQEVNWEDERPRAEV